LNKADFVDWKRHPVTQVVFSQLMFRIADLKDMLAASAGVNPVQDSHYSGAIKAYQDMLSIDYEEQEQSND